MHFAAQWTSNEWSINRSGIKQKVDNNTPVDVLIGVALYSWDFKAHLFDMKMSQV